VRERSGGQIPDRLDVEFPSLQLKFSIIFRKFSFIIAFQDQLISFDLATHVLITQGLPNDNKFKSKSFQK